MRTIQFEISAQEFGKAERCAKAKSLTVEALVKELLHEYITGREQSVRGLDGLPTLRGQIYR